MTRRCFSKMAALLVSAAVLLLQPPGEAQETSVRQFGTAAPDSRRIVSPGERLQLPYSAVCRLELEWEDGSLEYGSGVLVGPRHLLTAAHNCVQPNRRLRTMRVVPASEVVSSPFGEARMTTFRAEEYTRSNFSPQADLAAVTLDVEIGRKTGWLDFTAATDAHLSASGGKRLLAGYPQDVERGRKMVGDDRLAFVQVTPTELHYLNWTASGSSGSGLLAWFEAGGGSPAGYRVVGVHTRAVQGGSGPHDGYNAGARITPEREAALRRWQPEGRSLEPAPQALPGVLDRTGVASPPQLRAISETLLRLRYERSFPVALLLAGDASAAQAARLATDFHQDLLREGRLPAEGGVLVVYRQGGVLSIHWARTQALDDRLSGDAVARVWQQAAVDPSPAAGALRFLTELHRELGL